MIYAVGVLRDRDLHITGFRSAVVGFVEAGFIDGGVAYGPQNVLFLSRWPVNEMGQAMVGSAVTDKVIELGEYGVMPSPGGLNFVPAGFPGAGRLKTVSWSGGEFYDLSLAEDGAGTFDVTSATLEAVIGGGPEGFVYVPPASPQFPDFRKMLVSEFSDGAIAIYEVGATGAPTPGTREVFLSGLNSAEGAALDPLTGDFMFSTFGGGDDRVIAIHGFSPPSEVCDGIDNDADTVVDEGFDVGSKCSVGVGECEVAGLTVCTRDTTDVECGAVAGQPQAELCNDLDDDCDGETDEDFDVGAICTLGSGRCTASGVFVCAADGIGTVCNASGVEPLDEACNGLDDDCDGQVDEDFDLDVACTVGLGICAANGTTVCSADGTMAECDAVAGVASREECDNGLDDDCDGTVDARDESCQSTSSCQDADGDGFGSPGDPSCSGGRADDCNDSDPGTHPGAVDLPGSYGDEDCSGTAVCDPCAGWRNPGAYLSCVSQAADQLVRSGQMGPRERGQLIAAAARSGIGSRGVLPAECQAETRAGRGR
jgi:hypothetical protein